MPETSSIEVELPSIQGAAYQNGDAIHIKHANDGKWGWINVNTDALNLQIDELIREHLSPED